MHHSWCKKSGSDLWSVLQVGVSLKMTSVMNFVFGYIPLLKKFLLITNNPQNSFLIFIPYSFLCENFYQYISFQIYICFLILVIPFSPSISLLKIWWKKSGLNHEINSIFNAKTLNILNLAHINQLLSFIGIGIHVLVRLMNFSSCK